MDYSPQDVQLIQAATHGFSDYKSSDDEKVAFISSILNRVESGKAEFGVGGVPPSTAQEVLYSDTSPYYETSGKNERFNNAMEGTIQPYNKKDWKKTLQLVNGVMKGKIQRKKGQFIYRPEEVKKLKKSKGHDFKKTPKGEKVGRYDLYGYETETE